MAVTAVQETVRLDPPSYIATLRQLVSGWSLYLLTLSCILVNYWWQIQISLMEEVCTPRLCLLLVGGRRRAFSSKKGTETELVAEICNFP